MKNILITMCALLGVFSSQGQCPNGDLEFGSFSSDWKLYVNTTPVTATIDPLAYTPVSSSSRHTITSSSTPDAIVGSAIMGAASGSYGAMLGNSLGGAESEILSYTFTLTSDFSFMLAMVLENAHGPNDNPYFVYWLSLTDDLPTSTMGGNLLATDNFRPDGSFTVAPGAGSLAVYKPWTRECVMAKFPSLSAYVGTTVTIYFATADCPYGGHYAYAYIDDLCKTTPVSFTAPSSIGHIPGYPLTVDGTASVGVIEYYYSAEPCTATGIPIGPSVSTATTPGSPGIADIRPWFPPGFFVMTTYYKITLHAKKADCDVYAETSRIVYVN